MSEHPSRQFTEADYFAMECDSVIRHEYFRGQIFAMAGGSVAHNRAARNALVALDRRLQGGPCEAFGSDMRLKTPRGLLTYPDVVVLCGEVALMEGRTDTAVNPSVVVEVLSPSTRAYDLGEKLAEYQRFETLTDVLLVDPDTVWVRHVARQGEQWRVEELEGVEASVALAGMAVELPLGEIYRA